MHLYSKEVPLPGDLRAQSESVNAFYYEHGIYVHWSMSGDMTVFLREYTHQALLQAMGRNTIAGRTAIESALADYLPASFLGSPLIGEGLRPIFDLPTSYLRRLDNRLVYPDVANEPHARGEVWAGALWACRQSLGQVAVDRVPVQAWAALAHTATEADFETRFSAALVQASTPGAGASPTRSVGDNCPAEGRAEIGVDHHERVMHDEERRDRCGISLCRCVD